MRDCTSYSHLLRIQAVPHVHFHIIPKPNEEQGLGISWPQLSPTQDELKAKALFIIEKFKSN